MEFLLRCQYPMLISITMNRITVMIMAMTTVSIIRMPAGKKTS